MTTITAYYCLKGFLCTLSSALVFISVFFLSVCAQAEDVHTGARRGRKRKQTWVQPSRTQHVRSRVWSALCFTLLFFFLSGCGEERSWRRASSRSRRWVKRTPRAPHAESRINSCLMCCDADSAVQTRAARQSEEAPRRPIDPAVLSRQHQHCFHGNTALWRVSVIRSSSNATDATLLHLQTVTRQPMITIDKLLHQFRNSYCSLTSCFVIDSSDLKE